MVWAILECNEIALKNVDVFLQMMSVYLSI